MSYHDYRAYKLAQQALYGLLRYSGANALSRRLESNNLLVVMYHDVLTPGFDEDHPVFGMSVSTDVFASQLEYIRSRHNAVSLQQVLSWLSGVGELPQRPALITFDDGHRNNLTNAVPILSKMGMSAVFFVVTEMIGKCCPTWYEDIYMRIMSSTEASLALLDGSVHSLADAAAKVRACDAFFDLCRKLDGDRQKEQVRRLESTLEPAPEFPNHRERFEFLREDDLAQLVQNGFHVGSHALSHPILSTLADEQAAREIEESRRRLESIIGSRVESFAYPFGDWNFDYKRRDADSVKRAGYSIGFAGNSGFVSRTTDRFNVPRMGIGVKCRRLQFECKISGSLDRAKSLLQGR